MTVNSSRKVSIKKMFCQVKVKITSQQVLKKKRKIFFIDMYTLYTYCKSLHCAHAEKYPKNILHYAKPVLCKFYIKMAIIFHPKSAQCKDMEFFKETALVQISHCSKSHFTRTYRMPFIVGFSFELFLLK